MSQKTKHMNERNEKRSIWSRTRFALGPALALALIALPLAAPTRANDHDLDDIYEAIGDPVPSDYVVQNPQTMYGHKALVEGYVEHIYGPHMFTINMHSRIHRYPDLLVVNPGNLKYRLGDDDLDVGEKVTLVGVLRKGVVTEVEDLDDPDDDVDVDVDRDPVLIIEAMEIE